MSECVVLDCDRAKVAIDRLGRPTITANTVEDATYGLGWSISRDRRSQMDLLRRASHGELAEVLGPAGLDRDVHQRRLNLAGVAHEAWSLLPPSQQRLLQAFSQGVNHASPATDAVPSWRPVDSIAVAQGLFQSLASDGSELRSVEVMRRTLPVDVVEFLTSGIDEDETGIDGLPRTGPKPAVPVDSLRRLMAAQTLSGNRMVVVEQRPVGSNAWAITRSGCALLANDTHLELTRPSLWYQATLVLPGGIVSGVTVPGLPVVAVGASSQLAWGLTRLPGDVADLREVSEEDVTIRQVRIVVRGDDDVMVEVEQTRWGPVVGELAGRRIAFQSTLTDPHAIDFRMVELYGADTVDSGMAVVNNSGLPPVNVVLADRAGRIAWTVGGRFPDRGTTGPRGFSPHRAWRWRAAADLPRAVDPPGGVLVNCNNANDELREAGVAWNFFPATRAARVAQLLCGESVADERAALGIQLDVREGMYAFYRDLALRHLPPPGSARPPGRLSELRQEIELWTGTAHRDERGLALLVVFREVLREGLFAAVTGPAQLYDPEFTYCLNGHEGVLRRLVTAVEQGLVPGQWQTPGRFVAAQLLMAKALLTHSRGAEPVRWGETNVLSRTPVGPGTDSAAPDPRIELSGCASTVCVARPDFGAALRFAVAPSRLADGLISVPGSPGGASAAEEQSLRRWAAGHADALLDDHMLRLSAKGAELGEDGHG